jgi:hypothetical protein
VKNPFQPYKEFLELEAKGFELEKTVRVYDAKLEGWNWKVKRLLREGCAVWSLGERMQKVRV